MIKLAMIGTQIIHTYCYAACFNGCSWEKVEAYARPWMVNMMRGQDLAPVTEEAEIVKIWAGDEAEAGRIAEACSIPEVARTADEACTDVDGVLVLDEDWDARYTHVRRALNAGCHVFCDKLVSAVPNENDEASSEAQTKGLALLSWSQMALSGELSAVASLSAPRSVWMASRLSGEAMRTHAVHLYWMTRAALGSASIESEPVGGAGILCRHEDGSTAVVQPAAANDALGTLMAVSGGETAVAAPRNSYDLYQESARRMVTGMKGEAVPLTGAAELRAASGFMQAARA